MKHLIEDSRNKVGKHEIKHAAWDAEGVTYTRCALPVGDYAVFPDIAVDTKYGLAEIAQNIGNATDHKRFRAELVKAKQNGCKLFVLVENRDGVRNTDDVAKWKNPRSEYYAKSITGARLSKAMKTMEQKYGVTFVFCTPEEAADKILELLGGG